MKMLSLRARILLGAGLWSVGLFFASGLFLTHYMLVNREAPGIFHGFFLHYMGWIFHATLLCLALGFLLVRQGLLSFAELRTRLFGIREGKDQRLEGEYPMEVQPLVNEMNSL